MLAAGASDKEILATYPIHRSTLFRIKTNRRNGRHKISSLPVTESLLYSLFQLIMLETALGKDKAEVVLPAILNIPSEWGVTDIKSVDIDGEKYIIRYIQIKYLFSWLKDKAKEFGAELPISWDELIELRNNSRKLDKQINKC